MTIHQTILLGIVMYATACTASASSIEAQLPIKLDYAEGVLMNSQSVKRIESSSNVDAKGKLDLAREKYREARSAQQNGEFEKAGDLANQALRLVTTAAQMVPNQLQDNDKNKRRYQELSHQIMTYSQWHSSSSAVQQAESEEKSKIKALTEKARGLAEQDDYPQANELLSNVLGIVIMKANSGLKSRTFTYDLNFETPIDEYKYELTRNDDYLRLIPVAITQKQPSAGIRNLMDRFIEKSRIFRHDAEAQFEAKQFEHAVKSMQASSEELIRALKLAGVN